MNEQNQFENLLSKYLKNELGATERQLFYSLIRQMKDTKSIDDLLKKEWGSLENIGDLADMSWQDVLENSEKKLEKKQPQFVLIKSIVPLAAAITAIVAISLFYMFDGKDYKIYKTDYAQTEKIELEDGTLVHLNANSRIVWNRHWEKDQKRSLQLIGEAYFDVAHRDNKSGEKVPFVVRTEDLDVNVLGTAFKVTKRRNKTEVALDRGSIELILNEKMSTSSTNDTLHVIQMYPGDKVVYSSAEKLFHKEENAQSASWISGTLNFNKIQFVEIAQMLEDNYGKIIEFADTSLQSREVTIGLPYADWTTVVALIELSLNVEILDVYDKIMIKGKGKE